MTNLENRNPFDQPDRRKGGMEFIKSNWYIFKTSILLSLKLTTDNILGRRMHFTAYWATAQKTSTDCLGPHFLCAFRWDYVYYLIRRFSLRLKKKQMKFVEQHYSVHPTSFSYKPQPPHFTTCCLLRKCLDFLFVLTESKSSKKIKKNVYMLWVPDWCVHRNNVDKRKRNDSLATSAIR